jgi:predicted dithiol-disulfide oxidoreductase (DUF899 family)
MDYRETHARLVAHREEIAAIRRRMRSLQAGVEPQPVDDYAFQGEQGRVRLSELFGDRRALYVIHSMGHRCNFCTTWADGYNGVYPQLSQRAALVVAGPDAPEVQAAQKAQRGWRFAIVCHRGTSFARDMGYQDERGQLLPGLSVFRKQADGIVRITDAAARPGDDFSPLSRLLELLPEGWGDWTPEV